MHPIEIKLVDELLVGNPELFQVRERSQQAFHVRVVPHFAIAYSGENSPIHPGSLHLFIWVWQLLQHVLVHQFPVWVVRGFVALLAPPDKVAGAQEKFGILTLNIFTTSRATQSPPCSLNIVRRTPGNSFTSSTDA